VVLAYSKPHTLSKLGFGLLISVGSAGTVFAGDHFWLDTRAEARITFTDNALLTLKDRQAEAVLNLAPGLNARWESKRITAGVDYAFDYYYFLTDKSDDIRHRGFATLDAEVIEGHLTVNGRASLREQFLDQRGSISSNSANRTENRRLIENYTGSAILKGGLRRYADWQISYRFGISRSPADNLDDETLPVNFSDTESHEIAANLGSGDRFNNFEWRLFANSTRIARSLDVNDYRNENARGELTYKFNRFIQVVGNAGYTRNAFQSDVLKEDGFSWELGARWTPGRKLDMALRYGKEGLRETWYANLQYFFSPRFDLTGTYQDALSANTIVSNNSLQDFGFDEDLGISNAAGLPIDETDPVFTFSDVDFRRQNATATFTLRQKRTQMYLSGNMEWRTFDDGSGTAKSWGVTYGFDRNINRRSSLKGRINYRRSRFEGETRIDNYIEGSLDWTATISRYFKSSIGFTHSERQSSEPGADLEENALTFYLRGIF